MFRERLFYRGGSFSFRRCWVNYIPAVTPGNQETRERLYNTAVIHKEIFDPVKKLTSQYTQIYKKEFAAKLVEEVYDYDEYEKIRKQIEIKFSKFLEDDLVKIHECFI